MQLDYPQRANSLDDCVKRDRFKRRAHKEVKLAAKVQTATPALSVNRKRLGAAFECKMPREGRDALAGARVWQKHHLSLSHTLARAQPET